MEKHAEGLNRNFHLFGFSSSEDRLIDDSSVSDAMNSSMLSSSK